MSSDGPSQLTVYNLETDLELWPQGPGSAPALRGDRAIVRSHTDGREDMFAVFERAGRGTQWNQVSADLTAEQVAHWPQFRRNTSGYQTREFNSWLTRVRDQRTPSSSQEQQK